MTAEVKIKKKKILKSVEILPLTKTNYQIIGVGIIVILIGYICLSTSPWDGFLAISLSPLLLVLGYCVIIPAGIIYRKKKTENNPPISAVSE